MLLLVLLVLAFARPFQEILLGIETASKDGTHHVILLDASLSMGADGVWEAAKRQALNALDDVKPGDWVGVVRFAQGTLIDAPLSDDVVLAQQAIENANWTWEKGNHLVGLQAAADMLQGAQDVQRVVHFVSDFQATGLPNQETGWALPGHMRLHPVVVGNGDWNNVSVDALALRPVGQQILQLRTRIKNWQGTKALTARLWLDGEVVDAKTFSVLAGHASQIRFDVPERILQGFVEVSGDDGLAGDNRFYFTHQPAPKHQVLVQKSGPLHRLMRAAVPDVANLSWQVNVVDTGNLNFEQSQVPAVVVVGDVRSEMLTELRSYIQAGGGLFLPLQKKADVQQLNKLLQGSGIEIDEAVIENAQVPISWVDLKHRIFYPFRGAKFNDFSSVRYNGYHRLKVDSGTVLARFEGDDVMMAETSLGQGKIVIWAGGLEMDQSNLARSPRFVPLVHEVLRYLSGKSVDIPDYVVGDVVHMEQINQPGVHVAKNGRFVGVNVSGDESDPRQVTPAEFEIRMCEAPVLYRAGETQPASVVGGDLKREEYGYWILVVMFGMLLMEHFYAAWIESYPKEERV
ncbi:MAG: VWA domain-containing protein [Candidatus Latescibacteria bacterium]|nr:VWA domain-containing protein [Candidatus Latescibacterota bacterium]